MQMKKIAVVPYDEIWPGEFEKIRAGIAVALGELAEAVEHVGSTSVVGLWAKPIIDIDVVISGYDKLPKVVQRLAGIGYSCEGELGIEGRTAFRYEEKPGLMRHNLYVCPRDSRELRRHITFRNYLRSHPDAAEDYSRIKREAAALFPEDIDRYIEV